jgi:hypothetical protein
MENVFRDDEIKKTLAKSFQINRNFQKLNIKINHCSFLFFVEFIIEMLEKAPYSDNQI